MFFFYIEKNEVENLEENEEFFIVFLGLNVSFDVELVCVFFFYNTVIYVIVYYELLFV